MKQITRTEFESFLEFAGAVLWGTSRGAVI